MGDAPDPRDDADSSDDEGVDQSEPTESATAPADDTDEDDAPEPSDDEVDATSEDVPDGASDDEVDEAADEGSGGDGSADSGDESSGDEESTGGDESDVDADEDESDVDADDEENGIEAEDGANDIDADDDENGIDAGGEDDEVADGEDDLTEDTTDDASEDGADEDADSVDDQDSFGSPPESTFTSGEDWAEAMKGDGDSEDGDAADDASDESAESPDGSTDESPDLDDSGGDEDQPEPAEAPVPSDPEVAEPVEDAPVEGPSSDEEMPLAVHIEEMVRRLAIVLGVAGVVTLVAYPLSEGLIEFLWTSYIPEPYVNRPHVYGPLEYLLTKLKVAGLSGTIVGLPVFVYETYRFMKPGLYPHERRYYLASVPTSLILAFVGVAFSHFVILPLTILYFTSYTSQAAIVAFGLRETFNLIVLMMGYMAIIFQIPLFVMLAIMMGLVTREWMEDKRLLFWGGFGGLAFTFVTVDPTGMAPIIIAVTMIFLFEGTLALLRWTGN